MALFAAASDAAVSLLAGSVAAWRELDGFRLGRGPSRAWRGWGAERAQDVLERGGEQFVRGCAGGLPL